MGDRWRGLTTGVRQASQDSQIDCQIDEGARYIVPTKLRWHDTREKVMRDLCVGVMVTDTMKATGPLLGHTILDTYTYLLRTMLHMFKYQLILYKSCSLHEHWRDAPCSKNCCSCLFQCSRLDVRNLGTVRAIQ